MASHGRLHENVPLAPEADRPQTEQRAYTVYDRSNPFSVINLVPTEVANAIESVAPHYWSMTENKLFKLAEPSNQDQRLRIHFWDEYCQAQDRSSSVRWSKVLERSCTIRYWLDAVLTNQAKIAYIFTPPADYFLSMRVMLETALDRWREVLALPMVNAKGEPNAKVINAIAKITEVLERRVLGSVVQKLAVHQITENRDTLSDLPLETLEDIEVRLKRIKKIKKQFDEVGMIEGATQEENIIEVSAESAAVASEPTEGS